MVSSLEKLSTCPNCMVSREYKLYLDRGWDAFMERIFFIYLAYHCIFTKASLVPLLLQVMSKMINKPATTLSKMTWPYQERTRWNNNSSYFWGKRNKEDVQRGPADSASLLETLLGMKFNYLRQLYSFGRTSSEQGMFTLSVKVIMYTHICHFLL